MVCGAGVFDRKLALALPQVWCRLCAIVARVQAGCPRITKAVAMDFPDERPVSIHHEVTPSLMVAADVPIRSPAKVGIAHSVVILRGR